MKKPDTDWRVALLRGVNAGKANRVAMADLRRLVLGKRDAYLGCADGIVDSRLWAAVGRTLGEACTARNMATMAKLLTLIEGA